MPLKRPGKIDYYLGIAREVAGRSTCLRRRFGAIIVKNDQIISTGYNGSPRGAKNCIDLGSCLRQERNIPSGQQYELCRSVHAEMNAVIHAPRSEMLGGTVYLVGVDANSGEDVSFAEPCKMCKRTLINAGIKDVYLPGEDGRQKHILVEDWIAQEDSEIYSTDKPY